MVDALNAATSQMRHLIPLAMMVLLWASLAVSGLAFVYAFTCVVFNWSWYEGRPDICHVLWRLAPVTVVASVLASNEPSQTFSIAVLVISCCSTFYFLQNTRRTLVEGGPEPAPEPTFGESTVVITGANTGIGKETAKWLAQHYSTITIVMCCRNLAKAEQARQEIVRVAPTAMVVCHELDLGSLSSVRSSAAKLRAKHPKIDVLINNAGLMHKDCIITNDGFEQVFQVNYLSHYLWTRLLQPCGRIVNVTSSTYALRSSPLIPFEDLHCQKERSYTLFDQYALSKLSQIYFTYELQRRGYSAIAVHPGLVRTDVVRNMPAVLQILNSLFGAIIASMQKTPAQGAWGSVFAATTVDLKGLYHVNRRKQELKEHLSDPDVMLEQAKKLWVESAKMVNLKDE